MLKRDIDLTPARFTQARRSLPRRLLLALTAGICAGAVLIAFVLTDNRVERLRREVEALQQANRMLREAAAPLIELERAIGALEEKEALHETLSAQARPWSSILRQVEAALPPGFDLTALSVSKEGLFSLCGSGPSISAIAAYSQDLSRLEDIVSNTVNRIERTPEGAYRFTFHGSISPGEAASPPPEAPEEGEWIDEP